MEIFSCVMQQKRRMNVIRSLACEIRGDPRKLQIIEQFKKHHKNYEDIDYQISYNIFDDLNYTGYQIDSLYKSHVPNPFQAILDRNRQKKKKRYRRIMTLMNDNYSDQYNSEASIKSFNCDSRYNSKQTSLVKQQLYKRDFVSSYKRLPKINSRKITKETQQVSSRRCLSHRRCKSQQTSATKCSLIKLPQNSNKPTTTYINYLEKKGIQGEIEYRKNISDTLGDQYYEMSLRNRYEDEYRQPSFSYSIVGDNQKPSKFVSKLRKLRPEIMRKQKLLVKGISRLNKQKRVEQRIKRF